MKHCEVFTGWKGLLIYGGRDMTTASASWAPIQPVERADSLAVLREQMARAVAGGDEDMVGALGTIVVSLARTEIEKEGPSPRLREWQALVLDAAAAARTIAPAAAEELASAGDAVRHAVLMAARNPVDQLASRPTSRRILLAIEQLGGVHCQQVMVRELADQTQTHFSNSLKALRIAGLVVSESDAADGRERRLSLTAEGRMALAAYEGDRTESRHLHRLNVVTPDSKPHYRNNLHLAEPEPQS